jgi:site-specific recombinase XerD
LHGARFVVNFCPVGTLQPLWTSFSRDLRAARKSPKTIKVYRASIDYFTEFLGKDLGSADLEDFSRDNVKSFVDNMVGRYKSNTVRTYFSGLTRFSAWLVDEEMIEATDNPTRNVSIPAEDLETPAIISDDHLRAMLDLCKGKDFLSRRDAAMIRVLVDTGVRAGEFLGMTVSGTDLDNDVAPVLGKGGKVRAIYFSSKTVSALDRYIFERAKQKHAGLDALWITPRGAMRETSFRQRVAVIGERVGLPGLHPHAFRHCWAHTHLLNDTSTVDLKRLAGWSSDVMLERYGRSGADVRAAATARRQALGDRI